jgi:hypothetical protein
MGPPLPSRPASSRGQIRLWVGVRPGGQVTDLDGKWRHCQPLARMEGRAVGSAF